MDRIPLTCYALVLASLLLGTWDTVWAVDTGFRVRPYLQHPTQKEVSIVWFSHEDKAGTLTVMVSGKVIHQATSTPESASGLAYTAAEAVRYPGPGLPFKHHVRVRDLKPGTQYVYRVRQGIQESTARFTTAPDKNQSIRFIATADCETEPESNGKSVDWHTPQNTERSYLIDQTQGLRNNLDAMWNFKPDFVAISGDLVESGGEQRDWDEFWREFVNRELGFAAHIPLLTAVGNHEYFGGPDAGRYSANGSQSAIGKYRTYFDFPASRDPTALYYRLDYGPAALLFLDVINNQPENSPADTNWHLEKPNTGFHADSSQYKWLVRQLQDAQTDSHFTFVFMHYAPYTVGPHGFEPGKKKKSGLDPLSGIPVQSLTPVFMRYGVDAVFAGHDELWERSVVEGKEIRNQQSRDHRIHFYDVGTCGDGLRQPDEDLTNSHQAFLADQDAPEIWSEGMLLSGGRHYGHLAVEVFQDKGVWVAELTPVYLIPSQKEPSEYRRLVYDDKVRITQE